MERLEEGLHTLVSPRSLGHYSPAASPRDHAPALSDALSARLLLTAATAAARPTRDSAGRVIAMGLETWCTASARTATALEPPALNAVDKAALAKHRATEDPQEVVNDLIYIQQTIAGGVSGLRSLAIQLEQRTTATAHPEVTEHLRDLFRYLYAVHALIDERVWQRLRHARFDCIPIDPPPPVNWPVMHTPRHLFTTEHEREAAKMVQSLQSIGLVPPKKSAAPATARTGTTDRPADQRGQFFRRPPQHRGRGRGRPPY